MEVRTIRWNFHDRDFFLAGEEKCSHEKEGEDMSDQDALLLKRIAEQLGKAPSVSYDSEGHPILLALMAKDGTHIPEEVWECRSVQELRLAGFQFDTFPADIAKLTQLRSLRILSSTIGAFPSTMQALSHLEKLEGYRAHLEDITALCRLPALR